MNELKKNEIICSAYPVKYTHIDYYDDYIVVEQNRTRRRVPKGYYFLDDGRYIHISPYYTGPFQHKQKIKKYILNTVTKEWEDYQTVIVERNRPHAVDCVESNIIEELRR